MNVIVVDYPKPVLSLDRAKQHLRVDHDDENEYIQALIQAAQSTIDGPEGWVGRSFGMQTLELRVRSVDSCGVVLPCPPIIEVTGVRILMEDDTETDLDPNTWYVEGQNRLRLRSGITRPTVHRTDAVRIRYQAGYAPEPSGDIAWPAQVSAVPMALLIMVGMLYENRIGQADLHNSPTIRSLLGPLRRWD